MSAESKADIITLVDQSGLPRVRALDQLGLPRSTYYRWLKRMSEGQLKDKNIAVFDEMSRKIRSIIEGKEMPPDLTKTIASHYKELERNGEAPDGAVSVRSSGTESRPGMFETYLNVVGLEDVLDKIKKVWSSAYTARAIALRVNKDIAVTGDELGVAVSRMINAR